MKANKTKTLEQRIKIMARNAKKEKKKKAEKEKGTGERNKEIIYLK